MGGTEIGEAGSRETAVFRASDNTWQSSGTMQYGRWYAGLAALPDGRGFVTSGSLYDHVWIHGGVDTGDVTIGDLNRFGANKNAKWDDAIARTSTWPEERSGHAASGRLTIFGGRLGSGALMNDVWDMSISDNETGSEYTYTWTERLNPTGVPPRARHRTSAIADTSGNLWLIGGVGRNESDTADSVFSDVRSLHRDDGEWIWSTHSPTGTGPGPRYGHAAVFDQPRNRILLFGGASTSGGTAADATVYALNLGASPSWSTPTVRTGTTPSARLGHAMAFDPSIRTRDESPTLIEENRVVLFGGQSAEGGGFNAELWHLWIAANGDLEWVQPDTLGPGLPPAARAWHTVSLLGTRAFFFGGDTLGGPAAGQLYEFEVQEPNQGWDNTPGSWRTLAVRSGGGLRGATMAPLLYKPIFPRYAEIATPGDANSWQTLGGPLLQEWYPAMWALPTQSGSSYKVFFAGPSFRTGGEYASYLYDLAAGSWSRFPASGAGANARIKGGAAVLYQPGKIMKCGTRDTEGAGSEADSNTVMIDLTAGSPAWTVSDTMRWGRVNHNLTLLPTGEVLVTGGTGTIGNQVVVNPRREPELWNPDGNSGTGDWYSGPGDSLAASPLVKDYHSTAILLPDGRVLTAGGNADAPSALRATIYCPPYLFRNGSSDSLAPRPQIHSAPTAVRWGRTFTVCVSDTAGITRASLLAPGATTHGQDQNQRFIPLSFSRSPYGQQLYVTAPADSNVAPPGYYLLFLTGAKDGPHHYRDVPSVARWIRVKRDLRDTCDTIRPAIFSDFAVDAVYTTSVDLSWTEPGDDSTAAASGRVPYFDVRWSSAAISSQGAWDQANSWSGEPAPAGAGSGHEWTKSSLQSCTRYYIANRSPDDNQNVSLLHGSVTFKTLGTGCGALLADRGAGASRMERRGAFTAEVVPAGSGSGPLVVETLAGAGGGWTVRASRAAEVAGVAAADAGAIVAQVPDGAGGWRTVNRMTPPEGEDLAGLCALRDGGRYVLPADYSIEQVATSMDGGSGPMAVGEVSHSADGALTGASLADPVATDLEPGETLTASFAASGGAGEAEGSWHVLVRRRSAGAGLEQGGAGSAALLPARFALLQNAPNPFGGNTSIGFELPRASRVKIEVFDLLGRRMRTLTDQAWPAGRHTVGWDRLTDAGARLSSGVYLYRMTAHGFRDQKKLVIGAR